MGGTCSLLHVILAQPESLYWPLPWLSFRSAAEESASVFTYHPERSLAHPCDKRSRRACPELVEGTCGCLFCAVILNAVKDPCISSFARHSEQSSESLYLSFLFVIPAGNLLLHLLLFSGGSRAFRPLNPRTKVIEASAPEQGAPFIAAGAA